MSDTPGEHDVARLKELLRDYLSRDKVTNRRMRDILFPALLKTRVLTRAQLKRAFVEFDPTYDESKVGYYLSLVSLQLGMKKNDFLSSSGCVRVSASQVGEGQLLDPR
jgi:hypothetical protein